MSTDKRQVSTDALETLGTVIDASQKRDAIHLAVEPAVAAYALKPGDNIGRLVDGTYGYSTEPLGIVDPFLRTLVEKGQRFWLVLYPRQVTSLRHVWTHPAFPDEPGVAATSEVDREKKAKSKAWLESFAESIGLSYGALMEAADDWADSESHTNLGGNDDYHNRSDWPEFWKHWSAVTGRPIVGFDTDYAFFSCSC